MSAVQDTDTPIFPIGHKFRPIGKDRVYTVVDVLRTYNGAGQQVRLRYIAEYMLAGQILRDSDVPQTTILRGETVA